MRIGAVEHYANVVLPALRAQFCANDPDVQFDLKIGIPAAVRPQLGVEYDLVIGMGRQGVGANGGAPGTTVLVPFDAVCVCSRRHAIWRQRRVPLALQRWVDGQR